MLFVFSYALSLYGITRDKIEPVVGSKNKIFLSVSYLNHFACSSKAFIWFFIILSVTSLYNVPLPPHVMETRYKVNWDG